jgi:hypothetical protein
MIEQKQMVEDKRWRDKEKNTRTDWVFFFVDTSLDTHSPVRFVQRLENKKRECFVLGVLFEQRGCLDSNRMNMWLTYTSSFS